MAANPEADLRVAVVYAAQARDVYEINLRVTEGTTVAQALHLSGLLVRFESLDLSQLVVGVWGRKARPNQRVRDLDRIEIYRALQVDPKVARRERFVKQGARGSGLFARKRAGAKAGY